MAKRLVAVTNIKNNGEFTPAGETLDASKFDKKQLEDLYDAGAVRVEELTERPTTTEPTVEKTEPTENAEPATATKAAPIPAKSVAAPAVRESSSGKSNSK